MLNDIAIVTVMVENLDLMKLAYKEELAYVVIEEGIISHKLAKSWDAENVAGRSFLIMGPKNNAAVYIRFIQAKFFDSQFNSLRTLGWNAIEILVKNLDELFIRFKQSNNFKVVGDPVYINNEKSIKAMQIRGPSNELIYLTSIEKPEKIGLMIKEAEIKIDRVFIIILGVSDIGSLREFYLERFKINTSEPMPYRIRTLAKEYSLPMDTKFPLSIAQLSDASLVEIDEYPTNSSTRQVVAGELPPGIAMVSFYSDKIDKNLPYLNPLINSDGVPYNKKKSGVIRGISGELIEIIESN